MVLILYSGGADSRLMVLLAELMHIEPYLLFIDYGQEHAIKELEAAQAMNNGREYHASYLSMKDLKCLMPGPITGRPLHEAPSNVSPYYLPGRNTILLGIAAAMAEEHEIDRIWIGADFSDYLNKFPDCTQEYIGRMNDVLNVGLSRPITLEAPLLGLTKKMVISLLDAMGVPVTEYFSGYGLGEEE